MRPYLLPLALLYIASFADLSSAQQTGLSSGSSSSYGAVVRVVEGEPLTVECALRVDVPVEWRVDGGATALDLQPAEERPLRDGRLAARLYAAAARLQHAGLYTCSATGNAAVRVHVIPAVAPSLLEEVQSTPTPSEPGDVEVDLMPRQKYTYELGDPLHLNCTNPLKSDFPAKDIVWTVNGTRLQDLPEALRSRFKTDISAPFVLSVNKAREDDWGNYTCRFGDAVVVAYKAEAMPIARLAPNSNVVEGQTLTLTCKLHGKPARPVNWSYAPSLGANVTGIDASDASDAGGSGRFHTRDSPLGVPRGVLEIRAVERDDAGLYYCTPEGGSMEKHAAHTTLYVKDVYAALWPFLGICLEVFILCAVILVYEKRRTKPELEDSDADTHDQ